MSQFTELTNWYAPTTGIKFRTTKEVPWEIGVEGSGLWLRVPVDYEFDVSIPRFLWWLIDPRDPRLLKSGALHDYALLELGWPRVAAAAAFSESMRAEGVGRIKRLFMVLAVIIWKFN
jgi:hypothetical protein